MALNDAWGSWESPQFGRGTRFGWLWLPGSLLTAVSHTSHGRVGLSPHHLISVGDEVAAELRYRFQMILSGLI